MKEEYKDQISDLLGFEQTAINSALVSAQNDIGSIGLALEMETHIKPYLLANLRDRRPSLQIYNLEMALLIKHKRELLNNPRGML